jgi:copper chaperone CopZ
LKKSKTKLYINASNEELKCRSYKSVDYRVKNLQTDAVRNEIYQAISMYVQELCFSEHYPEQLTIRYNPEAITLSFIEYIFRLKGVSFKRVAEQIEKDGEPDVSLPEDSRLFSDLSKLVTVAFNVVDMTEQEDYDRIKKHLLDIKGIREVKPFVRPRMLTVTYNTVLTKIEWIAYTITKLGYHYTDRC